MKVRSRLLALAGAAVGLAAFAPVASGDPSAAKDLCKNGGYANYVDQNGNPFTNQGQCVKFANENGYVTPVGGGGYGAT